VPAVTWRRAPFNSTIGAYILTGGVVILEGDFYEGGAPPPAPPITDLLLLQGSSQVTGTDHLLLEGDQQSGSDRLLLE
jgi:hypothetical protein